MKSEPIETRIQMARMHDEMLLKLQTAMNNQEFVETSWICYAIFEQRVTRMIEKHIHKCPRQRRSGDKNVGIATRVDCIAKLSKLGYSAYGEVNAKVFKDVKKWCKRRNNLVHALLDLNTYKKYDQEFKKLAEDGVKLVEQVYSEATKVRNWCNEGNSFDRFPDIKCRCGNQRCIVEK